MASSGEARDNMSGSRLLAGNHDSHHGTQPVGYSSESLYSPFSFVQLSRIFSDYNQSLFPNIEPRLPNSPPGQTGRFPPGSDRSSCAGEQFDGPFDPHYFRRTVPDPFSEVTPSKWENENASSPPNQPCRTRSGFTDRFLSSHPIEDTSNILSAPNQRSRTLQGLEDSAGLRLFPPHSNIPSFKSQSARQSLAGHISSLYGDTDHHATRMLMGRSLSYSRFESQLVDINKLRTKLIRAFQIIETVNQELEATKEALQAAEARALRYEQRARQAIESAQAESQRWQDIANDYQSQLQSLQGQSHSRPDPYALMRPRETEYTQSFPGRNQFLTAPTAPAVTQEAVQQAVKDARAELIKLFLQEIKTLTEDFKRMFMASRPPTATETSLNLDEGKSLRESEDLADPSASSPVRPEEKLAVGRESEEAHHRNATGGRGGNSRGSNQRKPQLSDAAREYNKIASRRS